MLISFVVAPILSLALGATSAVHRCRDADGTPVFSDRSCASIGKTAQLPPPSSSSARWNRSLGAGCAASPDGLIRSVSGALQSGNVNSLAGLINWNGTNRSAARATMRHLQGVTKRESLEVALEPPEEPRYFDASGEGRTAETLPTDAMVAMAEPASPTGIRIDQLGAGGVVESLRFGLSQNYGCFWLRL